MDIIDHLRISKIGMYTIKDLSDKKIAIKISSQENYDRLLVMMKDNNILGFSDKDTISYETNYDRLYVNIRKNTDGDLKLYYAFKAGYEKREFKIIDFDQLH